MFLNKYKCLYITFLCVTFPKPLSVGVCVDNGWFKQPHRAQSDWSLGLWVRLHTCCTLRNQCGQVKPAIYTHTHTLSEFSEMATSFPTKPFT